MAPLIFRPGQAVRGERAEFTVTGWAGEGSYARVYQGEGPSGRVALKLAKVEVDGATERLCREREALSRLAHPAIPELKDAGCTLLPDDGSPGAPWLALRWVEGEALRRRLERSRGLPLGQVVPALACIADAVAALHTAGWVHGDLRPDNILLESGAPLAFLVDLGEARPIGAASREPAGVSRQRQSRLDAVDADLAHLTPDATHRPPSSDVRQLGELLAWALTGVDPALQPDRLSRAGGYHPAAVELWHEARDGRLPAAAFRDRLQRLARQLGLPAVRK
jgi:serine/threonine protein kinase